jgi:hypothetical protein
VGEGADQLGLGSLGAAPGGGVAQGDHGAGDLAVRAALEAGGQVDQALGGPADQGEGAGRDAADAAHAAQLLAAAPPAVALGVAQLDGVVDRLAEQVGGVGAEQAAQGGVGVGEPALAVQHEQRVGRGTGRERRGGGEFVGHVGHGRVSRRRRAAS